MKAYLVETASGPFRATEILTPAPQQGEVLVKVADVFDLVARGSKGKVAIEL